MSNYQPKPPPVTPRQRSDIHSTLLDQLVQSQNVMQLIMAEQLDMLKQIKRNTWVCALTARLIVFFLLAPAVFVAVMFLAFTLSQ